MIRGHIAPTKGTRRVLVYDGAAKCLQVARAANQSRPADDLVDPQDDVLK